VGDCVKVEQSTLADELLYPVRLSTAEIVLSRPCPVPLSAGVYAWYFDAVPPGVPVDDCHVAQDLRLLYVGISPKAPPMNGRAPSRQTVRHRIRYHYRGNAAGSTLRLTLGCLLSGVLKVGLRRVGSGSRLTFGSEGEARLTAWMAEHAFVAWMAFDRPWELEERLIGTLTVPLNLDQNRHSPFRQELTQIRADQRAQARLLPVSRADQ
jgi:hypothetical protein